MIKLSYNNNERLLKNIFYIKNNLPLNKKIMINLIYHQMMNNILKIYKNNENKII